LQIEGIAYLTSIWNYIDIIPPVGIFASLALELFASSRMLEVKTTINALTTFFMWFKLLYFMRIFQNTGYLIRSIVEVISDMRYFLFVLLIAIAAFGHSFLAISVANINDEENKKDYRFAGTSLIGAMIYTY